MQGALMIEQLRGWAGRRGWKIAWGGVQALAAARDEIERQHSERALDAGFYDSHLSFFRYDKSSATMTDVRTVILVALPRPAHSVSFVVENGKFEAILPPTYLRYSALFREVRDDLVASIPALAGHLDILAGPLKSVASRLGLVVYGRNNVTYIYEWGSYHQLLGYISDLEIGMPADWRPLPLELMPDCQTCSACWTACPTGAITDERVLLHAESCTTIFSEKPGELDHTLSKDCLFGCLECQTCCPANAGLLRIEPSGVVFNKRETQFVLDECTGADADIAASVAHKFSLLGLTEQALIGRNLALLVAHQKLH